MFFGQCNSPPTFQVFMNHIFADYLMEGWLIIYMDDLMVHSVDLDEHIVHVRLVLQCLCEHKLGIKLEKCIFCTPQAEYLGLIVGEGQISMDPIKLRAINEWEPSHSVSAVRSFMGFCNFYRQFISDFSNIIQPLLSLTKKNTAWQWLPDHASSFQTLKDAFLKCLVLRYPDTDLPFFVMTDASFMALGAVLMQKDGNGISTPAPIIQKPSLQPSETTISMITNCSQSYGPSRNGVSTWLAPNTLSPSSWIIRTWRTSSLLRISSDNRLGGLCLCKTTPSHGTTIPVLKWVQPMRYCTVTRLTPHSTTPPLPCCPLWTRGWRGDLLTSERGGRIS